MSEKHEFFRQRLIDILLHDPPNAIAADEHELFLSYETDRKLFDFLDGEKIEKLDFTMKDAGFCRVYDCVRFLGSYGYASDETNLNRFSIYFVAFNMNLIKDFDNSGYLHLDGNFHFQYNMWNISSNLFCRDEDFAIKKSEEIEKKSGYSIAKFYKRWLDGGRV